MSKLHIFDVDGTIVDSMDMWMHIYEDYLLGRGIQASKEMLERIDPMPVPELCEYLAVIYDQLGEPDEILAGIKSTIRSGYKTKVNLFEGARDELESLMAEGVDLVAFSNTPHEFLDDVLEQFDLKKYFTKILTVEDVMIEKNKAEAFGCVCAMCGAEPQDTCVHEDSPVCIEAAKAAGCSVAE